MLVAQPPSELIRNERFNVKSRHRLVAKRKRWVRTGATLCAARPGSSGRPGRVCPGQRLGEEVADLDRRDLVIADSVRRRAAGIGRLVRLCAEAGADVVVLGDPTAAMVAARAETTILSPVDSPLAFDSLAAIVAVVAAIAANVHEASGPRGRTPGDAIATASDVLGDVAAD